MKVKTQVILEMAIEQGVQRGWRLAHKHVENPEEHAIIDRINDAVMSAITEYFTFEDGDFL
jgi:hypothetical protein